MPDRRPTLEAEQLEMILCSCQRRFIPPEALVCELCWEEA